MTADTLTAGLHVPAAEVKRREHAAIGEIAATALHHANRLPPNSDWRELFANLGEALSSELAPRSADHLPPPGEPIEVETIEGRGHLRVVV